MKLIRKPQIIDAIQMPDQWSPTALKVFSEWLSNRLSEDWSFDFKSDIGLIFHNKKWDTMHMVDFGRMLYITETGGIGDMNTKYANEEYYRIDDAGI